MAEPLACHQGAQPHQLLVTYSLSGLPSRSSPCYDCVVFFFLPFPLQLVLIFKKTWEIEESINAEKESQSSIFLEPVTNYK